MTIEEYCEFGEKHLFYELCMFHDTANHIYEKIASPREYMQCATIESLTIHSRVVIDFFYTKPKYDDDAHVSHYLAANFDWNSFINGLGNDSDLKRLKERVNWEIAHLSYRRLNISDEAKDWMKDLVILVRQVVIPALSHFAKVVDSERIGPKMNGLLENIRKRS